MTLLSTKGVKKVRGNRLHQVIEVATLMFHCLCCSHLGQFAHWINRHKQNQSDRRSNNCRQKRILDDLLPDVLDLMDALHP